MTSCLVRVALLAVVLGATVSDSARPMTEVSASPPAPEVPALCLRDRPDREWLPECAASA